MYISFDVNPIIFIEYILTLFSPTKHNVEAPVFAERTVIEPVALNQADHTSAVAQSVPILTLEVAKPNISRCKSKSDQKIHDRISVILVRYLSTYAEKNIDTHNQIFMIQSDNLKTAITDYKRFESINKLKFKIKNNSSISNILEVLYSATHIANDIVSKIVTKNLVGETVSTENIGNITKEIFLQEIIHSKRFESEEIAKIYSWIIFDSCALIC